MPVEVVGSFMDEVEAWIASAFERSVWVKRPVERVRECLASGEYRLMLGAVDDEVLGAAVLEACEIDGRGVLFVVAAGGVRNEVFESVAPWMWRGLVEYARGQGLASVVTVGRPGWFRWVRRENDGRGVRLRQALVEAEV